MAESVALLFTVGVLNAMTPILLTAVGEIIAERAGVVNIGLEGIIMIGALAAAMAAEAWGPIAGLVAGIIVGAVLGVLHAVLTAYLKGDHIIPGIGVNTLALGLVPFALIVYWGSAGQHVVPPSARVPKIAGYISPIPFLAILVAIVAWYVLFRTPTGLKIRSVGENPVAADTVGILVERTQAIAVITGAALAGLAGAFMSIDWIGAVTKEIAAGRGFIALALVVFSNWNPLQALFGAALFGFFDLFSQWIKTTHAAILGYTVPSMLINTIPYVVTLIAVAGVLGRVQPPRHVGVPYRRE